MRKPYRAPYFVTDADIVELLDRFLNRHSSPIQHEYEHIIVRAWLSGD